MKPRIWQTARFDIALDQPQVMGIVNLTPDSFSDGGRYTHVQAAMHQCERLLREGAHLLDLGAESTRPGSAPLPLEQELQRLLPVLKEVVRLGVPVSVDTYKPAVMRAALDAGADIINDIWALRRSAEHGGHKNKGGGDGREHLVDFDGAATKAAANALSVVATHPRCGVCLMHMQGEPQTMQLAPMQGDVVVQVKAFLAERLQVLRDAGVAQARLCVDPGIGFGKTAVQNFALLAQQAALLTLNAPILAGWSRKSALGVATSLPASERLVPSVVAAVLAAQAGASVLRVHDVQATVDGLKVLQAMNMKQESFE
jgi:dihydropteroate synthase